MATSLPATALPAHLAACRPRSLPLLSSALHPEAPRPAPSPKAAGWDNACAVGCGCSGAVGQAPFQREPVWDPTASPGPSPSQPDPAQGNGPLTLVPPCPPPSPMVGAVEHQGPALAGQSPRGWLAYRVNILFYTT